jgi:transposase
VIGIDTALLARFREEADRTTQYLRDWSERAQQSQGFHKKTLHGDIMCLVNIIERAAERAGIETDLGFKHEDGRAAKFIDDILVRAKVIRKKDSNGFTISKAIQRYRGKVKELKNNQPN